MNKKVLTFLQLALGAGLIAFFFSKIADSGKLNEFNAAIHSAAVNWPFLLIAITCFFFCIFLCNIRWYLLLGSQQVRLAFGRTLVLYFIGQFFSSFMPGGTSGDLIKAIYVAREVPDKKTEVVSTVFIDRIIGLLGLIILCVIIMTARLDFFLSYKETRVALVFNVALLILTLLGSIVIFKHDLVRKWPFFVRMEETTKMGKILAKAYSAFHVCIKHPGILRNTLLLSIVNHVFFIACAYFLGMALSVKLRFIDYLTVFPVINAIAAIPITPGGLGMREGAAIFLLGALNVPAATALALSLLVYLVVLFWALVGGLVYIAYVYKTGYDARKEMQ
jgi:uncharacterized protein (TIRG00374 family)